jgi:hypothetical protein
MRVSEEIGTPDSALLIVFSDTPDADAKCACVIPSWFLKRKRLLKGDDERINELPVVIAQTRHFL